MYVPSETIAVNALVKEQDMSTNSAKGAESAEAGRSTTNNNDVVTMFWPQRGLIMDDRGCNDRGESRSKCNKGEGKTLDTHLDRLSQALESN